MGRLSNAGRSEAATAAIAGATCSGMHCAASAVNESTQKFEANCGSLRAAAQAVHTLYGWSRQPCHDLHPNVAQWRVPGHRGPMLRLPASTAARAHGVLSTHAQCCGSAATGSSGPARRCPTRHGPC